MFQCDNATCVSVVAICDGHKDCLNGADEESCAVRQCAPFQFRCANNKCIFLPQVCDGNNDCGDNSDELHCKSTTCPGDRHTCPSGRCISRQWLCDGDNDCGDESDESPEVCHNHTCDPQTRFQCNASRKCIPKLWKCDGDADCDDGSDESMDACRGKYISYFIYFWLISFFFLATHLPIGPQNFGRCSPEAKVCNFFSPNCG